MSLIEIIAVILFAVSIIFAMSSFFAWPRPEEGKLIQFVWDYGLNLWTATGIFILGMMILFAGG